MSEDNSEKQSFLTEKLQASDSPKSRLEDFKTSWKLLVLAPRDLWLIYLIKFFSFNSFATSASSLVIFLSETKEISDKSISYIFAGFGIVTIIIASIFLTFADRYGIRLTLLIGTFLLCAKLILMSSVQITTAQVFLVIFPGMSPNVFIMPALESSIKYYSTTEYRNLAISVFGSITYLSALFAGLAIQIILNIGSDQNSEKNFQILFIYCSVMAFIAFVLSVFLVDHEEKSKDRLDSWTHSREVLVLKNYWRLVAVCWLIVVIKSVFVQQSIILPVYMLRDLGTDEFYGLMIVANQLIIIVTLPLFSYLSYFISAYNSFLIVGVISVISPLPFLFGPSYYSVVSYILISSIGESILAQRIIEYSLEMAPKGKETMVMTSVTMPLIFIVFLSGIAGGFLLDSYCPEDGEKDCWQAWLVVSLTALPALLILLVFKGSLENKKFETNPFLPCTRESKLE